MNNKKVEKLLIKSINNLFSEKWKYLELGASQTDLVESYVIKTIKDTIKEINKES